MYEVEYILDGVRVASLAHAGALEDARSTAKDGLRRHQADHARIVHHETKNVEILRPTIGPLKPL
jgi:hypothetical protein